MKREDILFHQAAAHHQVHHGIDGIRVILDVNLVLERFTLDRQPIPEDKHRVTERERIALDRGRVVRPDGFELLEQLFLASRRNAVQKSHQMLMRSVVSRAGPTERTPSWPPTRSRMRLMYAFAFSGRAA